MPVKLGKHRRRGFSYIEMLTSIIVFALGLVCFMTIVINNVKAQADLQKQVVSKLDIDFLIEMMQTDVKSADTLEVTDGSRLQIVTSENQIIVYEVKNYMLRRNNEVALRYVVDSAFIPSAGDSIGIYIKLAGGELIDVTFSR